MYLTIKSVTNQLSTICFVKNLTSYDYGQVWYGRATDEVEDLREGWEDGDAGATGQERAMNFVGGPMNNGNFYAYGDGPSELWRVR